MQDPSLHYVPNSYWLGWTPHTLTPGSRGPKMGPVGFWSLSCVFGQKIYQKKLQGTPNSVGVGHLIGPHIWIWKDLGLVCFWSHGVSLSKRVYNTKVAVNISNSASCPNILLVSIQILSLNTLFKTSYESSWAMPGNPSISTI